MASATEVKVPDIGDFTGVPVVEVLVKAGDTIQAEDALITLESDKATMEVPAPFAGVVKEIKVKPGDKVSAGNVILLAEQIDPDKAFPSASAPAALAETNTPATALGSTSAAPLATNTPPATAAAPPATSAPEGTAPAPSAAPTSKPSKATAGKATAQPAQVIEVKVPDIGGFKDVPIIEILVKAGDSVQAEDPLITLESDKAAMEVPSPAAGVVKDVKVKMGDSVSEGSVILILEAAASAAPSADVAQPAASTQPAASAPAAAPTAAPKAPVATAAPTSSPVNEAAHAKAHASPSVRRFARELGVNLGAVQGSGPKGRIVQADVQNYVKSQLAQPRGAAGAGGLDLLPWPKVDFAKFGAVEVKPLSRIKKLSGANLARNWVMIPHVTQFDAADITELEAFRQQVNEENAKTGSKLTMLAFLVEACVAALKKYPEFNASLDGENLVVKKYFHIGFAADTPNGLVVPVIKNADQKGVNLIAKELAELAAKARDGKLSPADMQGGSFSISSLGGIGGTAFTPIINAPEVAILGVSKSATQPFWDGKKFVPRLMLPLSLSYDHRVVDGAAAARFTRYLADALADMRRVLL